MAQAHENLDERLVHRLLFFTDAVFAIVMTLLVLELKPPLEPGAMGAMAGKVATFTFSFSILAIFWLAHQATTRRLIRFDWPTAIANLVFLFPICLLPFVSAWVGEALGSAAAWSAYSLVLIACSASNIALVLIGSRGGGRLMADGMGGRERMFRVARAASPGVSFAIGLIAAQTGAMTVAQFCWLLIPPLLIVVRVLEARTPR